MSKRKYESAFFETRQKKVTVTEQVKKHTLDSDEEDFVDDDNILDENDIEGEEEGIARQEGEQRMTAFNMKEEMEEGHFDRDGHFIWNNEKEIRDNWLDNIDWQKIRSGSSSKDKYDINEEGLGDASSDSESEDDPDFDEIGTYKKMLTYMKPKETVNKALKRLGGADMKLSSVERLKRKKAGTLNTNEGVTNLTALANLILTKLGNMDVYQETYEQISEKIRTKENKSCSTANKVKEAELDMYADDFDVKEKEKIHGEPDCTADNDNEKTNEEKKPSQLLWEFKMKPDDEDIQGPHTTSKMIQWQKENYFQSGAMVRKVGETSNFYSLGRIDFELYE